MQIIYGWFVKDSQIKVNLNAFGVLLSEKKNAAEIILNVLNKQN